MCAAIEIAHIWIILTLGKYWTTRVVTVPGAPLVRSGAYGIFRHPNYLAVLAQIALLPLAFHAYVIAIVFAAALRRAHHVAHPRRRRAARTRPHPSEA